MSKPFDYSKWDNIELSDDEDDVHPNIDRESWFRMKHRSRVEREDNEDKDKTRITQEMEKANQRIKVLQHDLSKLDMKKKQEADSDSDDDDDDLDDREGLQAELSELEKQNAARQAKLDEYEKNKKWNVDNMFQVKEERTIVNPAAAETNFTSTGFVRPKDEDVVQKAAAAATKKDETKKAAAKSEKPAAKKKAGPAAPTTAPVPAAGSSSSSAPQQIPEYDGDISVMESYPEFTNKYADKVEEFMAIPDLEGSKQFLLQHAEILLQENASNYLLLASLEDEMNGHREKMKRTARQSQLVSHIAELAKTMKTHPGNVIMPFFMRLGQREHLEEFLVAVDDFVKKIIARAVVKKREIDEARAAEEAQAAAAGGDEQPMALADIPREERLGPGGLDPLEVIETLPKEMVEAFESREVQALHDALAKMDPKEAEYHMKRCVDSGLWVANK